jgi:nucleoid DNA-binding protein
MEEQLEELRKQLADRSRQAFEERFEQEAQALRRRAEVALEKLGDLDTPEKQELAQQIRARLEEQGRELRAQLAHRASGALDEQFEQESGELRRQAQVALRELGRLDTLEKIERARQIRARMEDGINHLKWQQACQLIDREAFSDQVRASALQRRGQAIELRDRTMGVLKECQEQKARLTGQVGRLQDRREGQAA